MSSSGLPPCICSQNHMPETTSWSLALPSCLLPSFDGQYLTWLWVLMRNWFTMDMPGIPLLSAGMRTIPQTHSWVESIKLCLAFASPTHSLASAESSPFLLTVLPMIIAVGEVNLIPKAGGSTVGWHCRSQHPRVHQQDEHLLPCLYRLGFELGLASENKIFGEFSCKTPSASTKHVPHFSVTYKLGQA